MPPPDHPGITGSKSRSQDGQRRDSLNVMCIPNIKDCVYQVSRTMHTKKQGLCIPNSKGCVCTKYLCPCVGQKLKAMLNDLQSNRHTGGGIK